MNLDYSELLLIFNENKVEYLVVGAHALAAHGHVRATRDLVIWVRPSMENASRVLKSLIKFGAPISGLSEADLAKPGITYQIGVAPLRIDLLTAIDGVTFESAWLDRIDPKLADLPVSVISRKHLIMNKRAVGRQQDLADVEQLERQKRTT